MNVTLINHGEGKMEINYKVIVPDSPNYKHIQISDLQYNEIVKGTMDKVNTLLIALWNN
ncbi:MAG TPA: hypothetical protein PLW93_03535 [Candidatus Absconditabacterales bacterium]|nr:hypothetical protein [Candidatus Absconditabacterales bacterium]